ncbi:MAG: cupin domain-containing protein [Candidatus Thorarchaeota archaeon]
MNQIIDEFFQGLVSDLPKAIIPFSGIQGWILQGLENQVVFLEVEPPVSIPLHSHGDQFGIVLEGEVSYSIGGKPFHFVKGDLYFVPGGVMHSAVFDSFTRLVDFFADADRYQTHLGKSH